MSSKTEIGNKALSKIGDRRVSNIETDSSERAQVINLMFDSVRDQLLAAYPWNFAIERVALAKLSTSPAWGYQNQYQLPTDFLSLLSIKNNPRYRVEKNKIMTDAGSPLYIKYISRITETGNFAPLFSEALSCELAVETIERISGSNRKKEILIAQRDAAIRQAYANDSIQDPPQELQESEWILSREDSVIFDDIDYNT